MNKIKLSAIFIFASLCLCGLHSANAQKKTAWQIEAMVGGVELGRGPLFHGPRYTVGLDAHCLGKISDKLFIGGGAGLEMADALETCYLLDHKRDRYSVNVLLPVFFSLRYDISGLLFTSCKAGWAFNLNRAGRDVSKEAGPMLEPEIAVRLGGRFHIGLGANFVFSKYMENDGECGHFGASHIAPSLQLKFGIRL